VLTNTNIAIPGLLYGPDEGDQRLRKNVASWLSDFYGTSYPAAKRITEERIAITGGASQNLACLLQVFTDPIYTRNVWLVSPSYMLVFRIFDDAGFASKLRSVPEDDEGIDIDFLRSQIRKSEERATKDGNNAPVSTRIVAERVPDLASGRALHHDVLAAQTYHLGHIPWDLFFQTPLQQDRQYDLI
jgi:histidinol-phosphate/aromatic aminotransferase/cobyric acid decarboxylase-like protein